MIWPFVGLIVLIKCALLPFAHTVHADAVSRALMAWSWSEEPHWIVAGVWLPMQFYIVGLGLMLWEDAVLVPQLINIACTSFTAIPVFFWIRRLTGTRGAWGAVWCWTLAPVVFRTSFMALSEPGFWLLLAAGLNALSRALETAKLRDFAAAGLWLTTAACFRFEAWLVMALLTVGLALQRKWQAGAVFAAFSGLFPVMWMVGNALVHGDFWYGAPGNAAWTMGDVQLITEPDFESRVRSVWYYPFSVFVAVGPLGLWWMAKGWKHRSNQKLWGGMFIGLVLIYWVAAFRGALVLQHRFTGLLVLTSLPLVAVGMAQVKDRWAWALNGALVVLASLTFNADHIQPVPRLAQPEVADFTAELKRELRADDALLVDFIGWENTYYVALHARVHPERLFVLGGADLATARIDQIKTITDHHNGCMVLRTSALENRETARAFGLETLEWEVLNWPGVPPGWSVLRWTRTSHTE